MVMTFDLLIMELAYTSSLVSVHVYIVGEACLLSVILWHTINYSVTHWLYHLNTKSAIHHDVSDISVYVVMVIGLASHPHTESILTSTCSSESGTIEAEM